MDRKDFIKNSVIFCGAVMTGCALLEACKHSEPASINFTLNLTDPANAALNTVGGYIEHSTVIVIRTGASTYVALTNICTHAGCTVAYNNSLNEIVCPCHGGTYDTNGNVISGPPPSPLTKYNTSLNGNTLSITA